MMPVPLKWYNPHDRRLYKYVFIHFIQAGFINNGFTINHQLFICASLYGLISIFCHTPPVI